MKATANAGSNIAFIKYWGVSQTPMDPSGTPRPLNASLSMTLQGARTVTTVDFQEGRTEDDCSINGRPVAGESLRRIVRVLHEVRKRAGIPWFAQMASVNDFPTAAGIASSASGFAALALAAARAAGLPPDPTELVPLALLGSGSACRSLYGGFVRWSPPETPGETQTSVLQVAGETHWELADLVAVVSREEKSVPSCEGHLAALTSPLLEPRIEGIPRLLGRVEAAVQERDLATLGEAIEADALSMHAVIMSSRPPIVYWEPATVSVIRKVQSLRSDQGPVGYFTIDAGPNVHVITQPEHAGILARQLENVPGVIEVLRCRTGRGAYLTDEHLF